MRERKKRNWKNILSMGLFVILVVILAIYVWENREDMKQMLALSWETILALLLSALGSCLVNCVYHLVIIKTYGIPLTLTDWMGVVSVSNAIAYVLPMRMDLAFSAGYYKRVSGLPYTKSASMIAGNIVFGVAFSLLQILAALLCIGFLDGAWSGTLWLLWGVGTMALTAFIVLALVFQGRLPAFAQKYALLRNVMDGFAALLRNRAMLLRLLGCLVAGNLCQLLLRMICFRAIGMPVTLYQALFYNSVGWMIGIVAIVPGNIGISESVMGVATLLMGALFQDGVSVSLLHRASLMAVHLMMGLIFAFPVYRRFTRGAAETNEPSAAQVDG